MILRRLWLVLFSIFLSNICFAKFVQDDSAAGLTLLYRRSYEIRKDLSFSVITEYSTRIADENSLSTDAVQSITFNPKFFKTKILSAKVINNGVAQEVSSEQIVLKDADSEITTTFDPQKSYVINFPNVKVGSIIYYKTSQETLASDLDPAFFYMGTTVQVYMNEWEISFRSEVPLHRFFKDEQKLLEFKSDFKDGKYFYSVRNTRPVRNYVVGEENVYNRTERFSYFIFSSAKEWKDYNAKLRRQYFNTLKQELPPQLKEAVVALPEKATQFEKVFQLVKTVAPKFRYFSDVRRINGEVIPRTLKEIETSGYADCKDISVYLSAALEKMGIKNNVVFVWRGLNDIPENNAFELPTDAFINHAVVRAEMDGKEYWLDGTNRNVYLDTPHPDIAGRKGILAEENQMRIVDIPPFQAKYSRYEEVVDYEFKKTNKQVRVKSVQRNLGYVAFQTMRDDLSMQENMRDFYLVRYVTGNSPYSNSSVKVDTANFDTKKEVKIEVNAELAEVGFRTSSGLGFNLPQSHRLNRFIFNISERDSDLSVGFPTEVAVTTRLHNRQKVGADSMECNIRSPWIDFRRKIVSKDKLTEVQDEMVSKAQFITNAEIKTKEFAKVQKEIMRCQNSALILK